MLILAAQHSQLIGAIMRARFPIYRFMIAQNLNFFSILVPLLMFGFGICVFVYHRHHAIPNYLRTYAASMICVGLSFLCYAILVESVLLQLMPVVMLLYFLSCALHIHSIHQCLGIRTRPIMMMLLVSLGTFGVYYFAAIDDQREVRLFVVSLVSTIIYIHQAPQLFKKRLTCFVHRWVVNLLMVIMIVTTARALILVYLLDLPHLHAFHEALWACTQFLMITVDILYMALFITATTQHSILMLRKERDYDPLTNVLNRRGLDECLNKLMPALKGQHFILLCDLDFFKKINDQYGHYIGDLVLKHICNIMRSSIRQNDHIVRMGGEEFMIILKDVESQTALKIAERIRENIQLSMMTYQNYNVKMTISIGISAFDQAYQFADALLVADRLLYEAKDLGRNVVQYQTSVDHSMS